MCCLTRRVEDPLCHPLAIANVGISMQCYQGMNGLNGDRFVTGTLTRPFSRPGQMNQCNSLICFNVWDFTSARSPFLKEAYPGDWRVCLREGFSNPKTHTHTISHYSASSLMTRFWYVMVCLYVQWKLKQRNGTGGVFSNHLQLVTVWPWFARVTTASRPSFCCRVWRVPGSRRA